MASAHQIRVLIDSNNQLHAALIHADKALAQSNADGEALHRALGFVLAVSESSGGGEPDAGLAFGMERVTTIEPVTTKADKGKLGNLRNSSSTRIDRGEAKRLFDAARQCWPNAAVA